MKNNITHYPMIVGKGIHARKRTKECRKLLDFLRDCGNMPKIQENEAGVWLLPLAVAFFKNSQRKNYARCPKVL